MSEVDDILNKIVAPEHPWFDPEKATAIAKQQLLAEVLDMIGEESTHYQRTCVFCGYSWLGLHCVHDGYQNPCSNCDRKPPVIDYFECSCESTTGDMIKAAKERFK